MDVILTKERIKELIAQKGLTFSQFANELGLKKQNLNACLETQKKDINLVIRMADVLGMSLYDFIGIPGPYEKDVYGCLYVKGKPVLINSKEEVKALLMKLDSE